MASLGFVFGVVYRIFFASSCCNDLTQDRQGLSKGCEGLRAVLEVLGLGRGLVHVIQWLKN